MTHETNLEHKKPRKRFTVLNTKPEFAEQLELIQRACFPTISAQELISAEQYRAHTHVFPEGQHTVLNEHGIPVACSTDILCDIDFDHIEHTYLDATGNNWLTTHDPEGEWLYGCDISVAPHWRGMKLSQKLYAARHALIRRLNLRGHVAGSMLKGYSRHKEKMNVNTYVGKVIAGELFDPVLSIQLRGGFKVVGILQNYNSDPSSDNKAALIVWRNPDYRPSYLVEKMRRDTRIALRRERSLTRYDDAIRIRA